MTGESHDTDWYYVGQYGELGPLSLDQMKDLVQDKVVGSDTYVWRKGMTDWVQAGDVRELRSRIAAEMKTPPPPPAAAQTPRPYQPTFAADAPVRHAVQHSSASWGAVEASLPKSDKNRMTAGLLNLIPGVGRFYLGYAAHGALQLITAIFCGVGFIWSIIDAIYILLGGVKYDGYGRVLND